ncbi:MAG TPA: hypothetical protein VHH35_21125 [Pyrinomonadaceae bacterium]|nr:hypothetical protein [Pyrinomonadaceae bacterium]
MKSYLQRDRFRRFAISLASWSLLLVIISSFAATFLPLITSAEESTMACCVGKTEGHCDSGLTAPKAPQPEPEPMCGMTSPAVLNPDEVTSVAEPVHTHESSATSSSTSPAAESNTVEQQCQMDCGACTTATSRHKRDSLALQRIAHRTQTTTTVRFEESKPLFSSNDDWTQISPRGPPSLS